MKEIFQNVDTTKYLSDLMPWLPSNCIFNKGLTGCGGSYLELHSKRNSVILVPTIELVKNKTEEGIQPVYCDIRNSEILKYLRSNIPYKKILGTYDSLLRIMDLLNPKEYFLLVDEYHVLFNSYVFRNAAITTVLNHFKDFKEFCFMSATPLNDLCILDQLSDVDRMTLIWNKASKVNIKLIDTCFTNKELLSLLNKDSSCNWHIFLNSVNTIRQIVTKLSESEYKVVCSKVNKARNQIKLNYESTLTPPKHYNFYTSNSFEGCDIYDKKGKTVIVCDTNIATTILDISTMVKQICGRLRDSIYKQEVYLILNTKSHRYASVTPIEFDNFVLQNIADGKRCATQFSNFDDRDKRLELRKYSPETYNSFYANLIEGNIVYDDNLRKVDLYNYKLVKEIYDNTITVLAECTNHNLNATQEYNGESWVREALQKNIYTFAELEIIFQPIFLKHGLKFSRFSLDEYFPTYTKKRKTIKGVKETVYTFNI